MGDPYLRFAKSDSVFDWLSVCVCVCAVDKILVHRFRLLCGGELIFSFKLHLSSVA